MKYYAGLFLTVLISLFPFRTVAVVTCDPRLGSNILASDCVEAMNDMHRFMSTIRYRGPMSFYRNTRNGPGDLPKGFTSLASCAVAVDLAGSFNGLPIRYDWNDHLQNTQKLINQCVAGATLGSGGSALVSGFRYILVNPNQDGLKLPECFRPVLPDTSDVWQCVMREYTLPAPQPPLGASPTQGANHPAPKNHLQLTGRESPPAGAQTPPGGTGSGLDNMGAAGTSGGSAAVRGFGAGKSPAAGVGGMLAAERESGSETTETVRKSGGSAATSNQFTTGNSQLRSGNGGHQPAALVWKSKQGNGPWMDWDGSQRWYNSNGYLRVGMANQAKNFPDPPIPEMVNKEISICSPKQNSVQNCKPVSGIWVYDGESWLPEETLLDRHRQRIHKGVLPPERLSVFRLDIQLGSPENQGDKIGKLEHDLLKEGCWIVIRGPTPARLLPGHELLLLAAEQLPSDEPQLPAATKLPSFARQPPAHPRQLSPGRLSETEPSIVRATRSKKSQKKQKVDKPAAKEKVVG